MKDNNYQVSVTPKTFWESRTVRTNAVIFVLAVVTFLLDQQRAGLLPFALDEKWLVFIIGVIGMVNMYLRTITEGPIVGAKP